MAVATAINPRLLAYQLSPPLLMEDLGLTPDPWQCRLLRSTARRVLVLSTRQAGKSTTCAVLGLQTVLTVPRALVVLVSASHDQSKELFRKLVGFYDDLGRPVGSVKRNTQELELRNGSRVLSLPANARTVRGYSKATLIVADEAAVMPDPMFTAISPMLAVSGGRLILITTPFGQRGYFFDQWGDGSDVWERYRITADQCLRISAEHLEAERRTKGELEFNQEYMCVFNAALGQYFSTSAVLAAFDTDEPPLFAEGRPSP